MDGRVEGPLTAMHCASHETGNQLIKSKDVDISLLSIISPRLLPAGCWSGGGAVAIDILTEDALLEVFAICVVVDTMIGRRWCTCVGDRESLFSVHQATWFCCFFARPQHL
jgi:hypothetical protein